MKEKNMIIDIYDIELKNKQAGHHWFDKDTKRYFNSRVSQVAYVNAKTNQAFFVSSEKSPYMNERKYSVRSVDMKTGHINTVGEFMQYHNSRSATRKAKKLTET